MPKTIQRFNKNLVRAEAGNLYRKINSYFTMTSEELVDVLRNCFPSSQNEPPPSREECIRRLTASAYFYFTNVLQLD